MDDASSGHHCRGRKIIPFSMHNVDEVLDDVGLNIPARVRASHWLNPVDPTAYRNVTPALVRKLGQGTEPGGRRAAGVAPVGPPQPTS